MHVAFQFDSGSFFVRMYQQLHLPSQKIVKSHNLIDKFTYPIAVIDLATNFNKQSLHGNLTMYTDH